MSLSKGLKQGHSDIVTFAFYLSFSSCLEEEIEGDKILDRKRSSKTLAVVQLHDDGA